MIPELANTPMPPRIAALDRDARGYPVPYFVAVIDGVPDFRVGDADKLRDALKHRLCWICGQKLGQYLAFVIGPMCAVNRISAEPPSHRECAEYAVKACPFLARPHARRRDVNLPDGVTDPPGQMITRNPGVTLLWITKSFAIVRTGTGLLFRIGDPLQVACYAEGRTATTSEIATSMETGLPLLAETCTDDEQRAELADSYAIARALLTGGA